MFAGWGMRGCAGVFQRVASREGHALSLHVFGRVASRELVLDRRDDATLSNLPACHLCGCTAPASPAGPLPRGT